MATVPFDVPEPDDDPDEMQDTGQMVALVQDRKIKAAMLFLREALKDGPRPAREVEAEALAAGHAHTTIAHARKRAYIRSERIDGHWIWSTAAQRKAAAVASAKI